MGPGQLASQPGRVVGWPETGMSPSALPPPLGQQLTGANVAAAGRRKVPASILRLRGAGAVPSVVFGADSRRAGRRRATSGADRRGAGCLGSSREEGAGICRRHREQVCSGSGDWEGLGRIQEVRHVTAEGGRPYDTFANGWITMDSALKKAAPDYPLLVDLEEKSALFDKAAAKYSAKVSA